jgi:hypothetical protein
LKPDLNVGTDTRLTLQRIRVMHMLLHIIPRSCNLGEANIQICHDVEGRPFAGYGARDGSCVAAGGRVLATAGKSCGSVLFSLRWAQPG